MRLLGLLAVCLVSSGALAQPVTRAEVSATLVKTEGIFRTVLKLPAKTILASTDKALATRAQIIDGFYALYTVAKPKFTMSLPAVPYEPKRLAADIKGETRIRLEKLIKEQLADLEAEQAAAQAAAEAERKKAQAIRDLEHQQAELEAKLAELKAHAAGR